MSKKFIPIVLQYRTKLGMVILGQIMSLSNISETCVSESDHSPTPRKSYIIRESQFAQKCFVSSTQVKNLVKTFKVNGLEPRIHGNTKSLPKHILPMASIYRICFLLNYAEQNGLVLPARIPGYSRLEIKLLPSSVSKRKI